jgi:2-iminobutanoate/2-iminopropanoate deaminase
METVATNTAPTPAGHYSQAVVHGDLVFVSGQLPIDPRSEENLAVSIEEQTRQALRNMAEILDAAGSGIDRVLKTTVYISDMELWGRVNRVYAEFFGEHRPARAVVPTRDLHFGFTIEIEAIATIKET